MWLAASALPALAAVPAPGGIAAANTTPAALFARVRPAVIGVRTLLDDTGELVSSGSGFFVDAQGRAVTNYHVVAGYLSRPDRHRLQAVLADGRTLPLRVLNFQVVDDLAIVQVDARSNAHLRLPSEERRLEVGTRVHAFGDPQRLGVTVTSGHFSSMVRAIGLERIHFTGVLNDGMSGGPAVDARGEMVGINAARMGSTEQISFLVPAHRAAALYGAVVRGALVAPEAVGETTRGHLVAFQREVLDEAMRAPWSTQPRGPYQAPAFLTDRLQCESSRGNETTAAGAPVPLQRQVYRCGTLRWIELDDSFTAGGLAYKQTYLKRQTLNRVQFNHAVQGAVTEGLLARPGRRMAGQVCSDRRTLAGPEAALPVRLLWCAQAYREFAGLYDVQIGVATRDRADEALVVRMTVEGVSWDTATAYTKRLLETIR
ncbi:MAG: S1C family serine protease [Betaproteobacteria bacterium]